MMNPPSPSAPGLTFSAFQSLIRDRYYRTDAARGTPGTFMWLVEEFGELSRGLQKNQDFYIEDAIGDCAVVLCIIAAQCGMSFGKCLESAWDEIKDRRGQVVNGVFVKEVSKSVE
jgi:NTP pyrophosphatase (non-canonical NTP hydrolase)